jgi:hypothetical protein
VKTKAHLVFLAATFLALPSAAQTGTVTFYSYAPSVKQQLKAVATRVGTGAFTGWLYDGDKRIAHASRGRFMTFQLASGGHDFSVSYKSDRPSDTSLHLDIEPDAHYCVRLSAKVVALDPGAVVGIVSGKIEQIACSKAVQEAGGYRRIELKRVDSAFQVELDASLTFPQVN